MYDRPYQSWRSPSIARNRSACDRLVWSPWSPERTRACFARFVCKGISLFSLVPLAPNLAPDWSFAEELKKEAGSERTVGPVQTFFFRAEDRPWSQGHMGALAAVDTVIHLSRGRIRANVYPAVDVLTSRSRLIETKAVSNEHEVISASCPGTGVPAR